MAVIDFLNRQVPDRPKIEVGIGGFTALVFVNENITLSGESPTSYLEDGSFASDHIVLNPLVITLEGEVSDINLRRTPINEAITRAQAEIGVISTYLPSMTQSQIQKANAIVNDAMDIFRQIDSAIDNGKQVYDLIGGSGDIDTGIREQFLERLEGWHYGKQLISITTEFRLYENMWISSVSIDRDNQSNALKFKITAQEVREASVEYAEINDFFKKPSPGLDGKVDSVVGKGPQVPDEVNPTSLAKKTYDNIVELLGLSF